MIGPDGRQIDCSIDLSQCDFLGQGSENLLLLKVITTLSNSISFGCGDDDGGGWWLVKRVVDGGDDGGWWRVVVMMIMMMMTMVDGGW